MDKIRIQFTLFSAFYSPLISAMSGGFLKAEGLDPEWSVAPPGVSALAALERRLRARRSIRPEPGFTSLNKGKTPRRFTSPRSTRWTASSSPARAAGSRLHLEKAGRRRSRHVQGRPAARHVQVRVPQGRHRLRQDQAHRPRAAPARSTAPSARARDSTFSSRARIRSSCRPTASGTSWRKSASRSAPAVSPASPRRATGSRPTWRRHSCAPTGRPAST